MMVSVLTQPSHNETFHVTHLTPWLCFLKWRRRAEELSGWQRRQRVSAFKRKPLPGCSSWQKGRGGQSGNPPEEASCWHQWQTQWVRHKRIIATWATTPKVICRWVLLRTVIMEGAEGYFIETLTLKVTEVFYTWGCYGLLLVSRKNNSKHVPSYEQQNYYSPAGFCLYL